MELRHLRYFLAVAEERHFGRAAARLHMAQPPLSQQIRQLESELGVQLLNRNTRRVELTEAGAAYLDRVRAVLSAVDDAGEVARRVAAGLQGRLSVGCVGSATYSLLPAVARRLREELPGVEVAFRGEMLGAQQVAALQRRDIDVALLRPPVDDPGITVRTLRSDALIVALPDGHPLTNHDRLDVTDLRDEDFVIHAERDSAMYGAVRRLCDRAGFEPRIRHEVVETSTLVTFVAADLGLAIVPEPVAQLGVPGATYRPLTDPTARIDLALAVRAGEDSPVIAQATRVLTQLAGPAVA